MDSVPSTVGAVESPHDDGRDSARCRPIGTASKATYGKMPALIELPTQLDDGRLRQARNALDLPQALCPRCRRFPVANQGAIVLGLSAKLRWRHGLRRGEIALLLAVLLWLRCAPWRQSQHVSARKPLQHRGLMDPFELVRLRAKQGRCTPVPRNAETLSTRSTHAVRPDRRAMPSTSTVIGIGGRVKGLKAPQDERPIPPPGPATDATGEVYPGIRARSGLGMAPAQIRLCGRVVPKLRLQLRWLSKALPTAETADQTLLLAHALTRARAVAIELPARSNHEPVFDDRLPTRLAGHHSSSSRRVTRPTSVDGVGHISTARSTPPVPLPWRVVEADPTIAHMPGLIRPNGDPLLGDRTLLPHTGDCQQLIGRRLYPKQLSSFLTTPRGHRTAATPTRCFVDLLPTTASTRMPTLHPLSTYRTEAINSTLRRWAPLATPTHMRLLISAHQQSRNGAPHLDYRPCFIPSQSKVNYPGGSLASA